VINSAEKDKKHLSGPSEEDPNPKVKPGLKVTKRSKLLKTVNNVTKLRGKQGGRAVKREQGAGHRAA